MLQCRGTFMQKEKDSLSDVLLVAWSAACGHAVNHGGIARYKVPERVCVAAQVGFEAFSVRHKRSFHVILTAG